jgi:hypothetical protein
LESMLLVYELSLQTMTTSSSRQFRLITKQIAQKIALAHTITR